MKKRKNKKLRINEHLIKTLHMFKDYTEFIEKQQFKFQY